jgi:hypothetical protein
MKPLPWSYTALDDFDNCPRAYHAKKVEKRFKEEDSPQLIWGRKVHEAFEFRIRDDKKLPKELLHHEPLMEWIMSRPGDIYTERKIAMDTQQRACGFFDKRVWMRGVIDLTVVETEKALILDYKTGKKHSKFKQLKLFALYTFAEYPSVNRVKAQYYWTETGDYTGEVYARHQIKELWNEFVPSLRQYVEAFKTDTWQPRQSGLCNGWCPVTDCEFWKPKRKY